MNRRIEMVMLRQIFRLHYEEKRSDYRIGKLLRISKNTVKSYCKALEQSGLGYEETKGFSEEELLEIFATRPENASSRYQDFLLELPYIQKELQRRHVDRRCVWLEYRNKHPQGYSYSHFCHHLQK